MKDNQKNDRNKVIVTLRDAGWSFAAIGIRFCISKQTVHEIYHREKGEKPKQEGYGQTRATLVEGFVHSQKRRAKKARKKRA